MGRMGVSLRRVALLAAAALAVHEGAYALAGESTLLDAGAGASHAYLWHLAPVVAVLLVAGCGQLALALARASWDAAPAGAVRTPLGVTWLASSAVLSSVWLVQEWLEAALGPAGLAEALGAAGQAGVAPFIMAAAFGGLVAVLLRGADEAVSWAAARPRRLAWVAAPLSIAGPGSVGGSAPLDAMARNLAGRGPPLLLR